MSGGSGQQRVHLLEKKSVMDTVVPKRVVIMLRRVQINHYRSCKDVVIDGLSYVTALVGRNGSGKTNILRAIQRSAHTASLSGPSNIYLREMVPGKPGVVFVAEVASGETMCRYSSMLQWAPYVTEKNESASFRLAWKESLAISDGSNNWK